MGLIHKLGQNALPFFTGKTLKTTCAGRTDCTLQRVTARFHFSCAPIDQNETFHPPVIKN